MAESSGSARFIRRASTQIVIDGGGAEREFRLEFDGFIERDEKAGGIAAP
jgi:hypothetical protein